MYAIGGLFGKGLLGLNMKVIDHIRFAKAWLDKAEHQFQSNESIQGELTLTLAQAELRCAWEKSHTSRTGAQVAAAIKQRNKTPRHLAGVSVGQGMRIALILVALLVTYLITTPFESPDRQRGIDGLRIGLEHTPDEDVVTSDIGRLKEDIDMGLRQMATVFAQSGDILVADPNSGVGFDSSTRVIVDKFYPHVVDGFSSEFMEEH